jgi:hypothetical protein
MVRGAVEFRSDGVYIDYNDPLPLDRFYSYRNDDLAFTFRDRRSGARGETERGRVDWVDEDTFTYEVTSHAGSIERRGWTYVFRRN